MQQEIEKKHVASCRKKNPQNMWLLVEKGPQGEFGGEERRKNRKTKKTIKF